MKSLIYLIIWMTTTLSFAQKQKIYSLQNLINNESVDSLKVIHLNNLADVYSSRRKYKEAEKKLQQAASIAENSGSIYSMSSSYLNLSQFYNQIDNPVKELEFYKKFVISQNNIELQEKMQTSDAKSETLNSANEKSNQNDDLGQTIFVVLLIILSCISISYFRK